MLLEVKWSTPLPQHTLHSFIVFLRIPWTPAWAWVFSVLCTDRGNVQMLSGLIAFTLYSCRLSWSRRWTPIDYWPFSFELVPVYLSSPLCMSVNWRTLSTKGKRGIHSRGSLQNHCVLLFWRCHFSNKLFQIKLIFISKSPLGVSRSYKRIKIYSDLFVYYKIRKH